MNLILAAGPDGYTATDYFTEDQYNTFWAAFNAAGVKFAQEILDYVVAEGYAAATDSVAAQAGNWGFELAEDATVEDFWAAIVEAYGYDISDEGINKETAGTSIAGMLCEGRFALYLAGEPYKSGLKAQGCGKLKKAVFSIELDPDEEETEE